MTSADTCPCETDDPNPGPHLPSCPWSDPDYDDGVSPPFATEVRWLPSPVTPNAMLAGFLRTEADARRDLGRDMAIHHILEGLNCVAWISLNRAPFGRRRRGKAPSRSAIARYRRRAHNWNAAMTQHLLAAEAFGKVIENAGDIRRTADQIEETR